MTPQRLIVLALSAFVALPSVALAAPEAATAEKAQNLADKITKEILGAASTNGTLEIQGKVDVHPDKEGYAFTIPPVRGTDPSNAGSAVVMGKISGHLSPTDQPDTFKYTGEIASPILKMLDPEGNATFEVTAESQSLSGVWNVASALSYTAVFDLKNVVLSLPDPSVVAKAPANGGSGQIAAIQMAPTAKIAHLQLSSVRAPQAVQTSRSDGKTDISLTGFEFQSPQSRDRITVDQASLSYDYQGYDGSVYDKAVAEWNGQIPLDFTAQLASRIAAATEGAAKGTLSVRGVKGTFFQGTSATPEIWTLAQIGGNATATVKNNLMDGRVLFSHEGLIVPETANIALEVLPKTGKLDLSFEALRFDALVQSVLDSTNGTPSTVKVTQNAVPTNGRIPQIKLNGLSLNARSLSASATGLMRVDKASPLGLVGEINARLDGLDDAVARTTAYTKTPDGVQDASAQMLLVALSTANVMGQSQQGQSAKAFNFSIDPTGALLMNGSPLASFMPKSAPPATEAPTPLPPQ